MKNSKRLLSLLLLAAMLLPMLPTFSLPTLASGTDAMDAIEADNTLASCKQGSVQRFDSDGYIGIPYEVTVYYDAAAHGKAKAGFMTGGATPVMMYVVNANFERIGTDSDVSIIKSMLARGYAVVVVDYLGNAKAKSPDLDRSSQKLRQKAKAGDFFKNLTSVFESGEYADTLTVPSGYNVRLNDVFFEHDKHGVDGTLDRIVNVWNNDFRKYHKDKYVKWVHEDGTRKATQNGFDGSSPVWYSDAAGKTVDAANGQYTKIQYTKAEVVTDCVKPDGTPIDLNLYIHVIYPTSPEGEVPVMTMFSSSGYLINGSSTVARPQMQGFLFDGYAGVLFDYAWIPMGRNDHYGYFDGSSGNSSVTGDNQSYATYTYNAAQVATAAMRYTRYLALSEPETYAFDIDALGVFGISKAAWMTQLGAPMLREDLYTPADGNEETVKQLVNDKINGFYQQLWLPDHHGETRYDNGLTESYTVDGFTVDGGELQPFATWNGYEISSGAQMVYSSCGASIDYFCEGYSPQFITENLQDTYNTEYGKQNEMVNLCRNHNIPALWYEANIAHTFAEGLDYRYGVDIYDAFHEFADYYLKGEAVSVTYTDPMDGAVLRATDTITVKFIGDATAAEISKITVVDSKGVAATGTWESAYGETEWTFIPDALSGGETYTLTIPADFAGKNGAAMGTAYTATFYVRPEGEVTTLANAGVIDNEGTTISLTVPSFAQASSLALRVRVTSDAANLLAAYDAVTGALLGSVRVSGKGFYEIDVTEALSAYGEGATVQVKLCTENASGNVNTYSESFNTGKGDFSIGSYTEATEKQAIDGEIALKLSRLSNYGKFDGDYWFYERGTVLTNKKVINNGANVTREDMGRRFIFKIRLYDTVSRRIMLSLNSATSKAAALLDFDRVLYTEGTEANAWNEYEIPYTIYESEYGLAHQKQFYLTINSTGDTEMPVYVDQFDVYEVFTDVEISSVVLASGQESDHPVKAPVSENAFSEGGTEYATWKEAMSAASSGATVTMLRNYTLTDADLVNLGIKNVLTIDLGGYRLTADNTAKAPLWIAAGTKDAMSLTLKNGSVILGATPLVTWSGSTAAGSGKVVDLSLENVYLANSKSFPKLSFFSEDWIENAQVTCNVVFTDCTIDLDRYELPNRDITIFDAGSGLLSLNYSFAGGKLILNDLHDLMICETIAEVRANADGEYPEILVPSSEGTPVISFRGEDGYAMPKRAGTENGYIVFVPDEAVNSSEYGAIPDKYLDAQLYPFVIFADELCIGAAGNLNSATLTAQSYMDAKNGSTVAILLRRNLDNKGMKGAFIAELNGTLIIDLGEHVLTRNDTVVEGIVSEKYASNYDTALVIKNGTFLTANATGSGHVIAFESKGATEKNYDIRFEDLTFALANGSEAGYLVTRCWGGSGEAVNVDMTVADCIFDFSGATEGSKVPTAAVNVFHMSNSLVKADVRVIGGQILSSTASLANVTWGALDAADTLYFEPDENDQFTTLTVPNGVTPSHALPTKLGSLSFSTLLTDGADKDVYALTNDSVKTAYGSIPAANSGNVFALFMDGTFVGAKDTWSEIQNLARTTLDANPGKTVTILMSQDHSHGSNIASTDRIPMMKGSVVVDLGGKTLSGSKTFFECGVSTAYAGGFDTSYTVKNGYINVRGNNFFASESRGNNDKHIELSFVDVEINLNGSSKDKLFTTYADSASYTGKNDFDVLFDGCTLDLRGCTASSFNIFNFGSSANNVCADITFKGGQILADKASGLRMQRFAYYKDTFTFVADESGAYTTLTLPASAELSTVGAMDDQGRYVAFGGGVASGSNTVYSLVESDRVTKYGIITSTRTTGFVSFNEGVMLKEVNDWNAITDRVLDYFNSSSTSGDVTTYPNFGKNVQILMLSDYSGKGSGTTRLSAINGTVVFDLGGHTFTKTGTVFECAIQYTATSGSTTRPGYQKVRDEFNGGKDFATNVIVCNGTIASASNNNSSIIATECKVTPSADDPILKTMNFTFDHVEFDVVAIAERFMFLSWTVSENAEIVTNLNYNDCIFDYTLGTTKASYFVKNGSGEQGGRVKTNVVLSGGTVKGDMTNIHMSATTYNTFKYVRGTDGEYPIFALTAGNPPSKVTAVYDEKGNVRTNQNFAAVSTEGGVTTYRLGRLCKYGLIEPEYNYEKGVPFVLFVDGKAVAGGSNWANMTSKLSGLLTEYPGKTVTVYVQYDTVSTGAPSQLAFVNGTVDIDLNGHSLTANAHSLFEFGTNKYSGHYDTAINVMNGTILLGKGRIAVFESKTAYDKHFDITFNGVTFGLIDGYATTEGVDQRMFFHWDAAGEGIVSADIDFTDCTFDFGGATAEKKITVFNLDSPNLDMNVSIAGGEIKVSTADAVDFFAEGSNCSLTLAKNASGAYPVLTVASGAGFAMPFATAEGDGYYYRAGNGVYLLGIGRAKITGASLNIGADLSMLYYVRIHDASLSIEDLLMRFSMAGKSATVTEYTEKDGEYIFVLSGIAPQQIGDAIDAMLLLGDEALSSKTGYSIKDNLLSLNGKSAEALGVSEEKLAAMKTLIADLLVYGKAAQDYVDYAPDAPILGGTEPIVPSTVTPTEDDKMTLLNQVDPKLYFKSAAVYFDTFNDIRIKIYVGSLDTSLVSVRVDGVTYALSELKTLGDGIYLVEISGILATELDTVHTVTLVYDGVDGASLSYSVYAYAYDKKDSADENMKALALAIYRYGVSADAYAAIA